MKNPNVRRAVLLACALCASTAGAQDRANAVSVHPSTDVYMPRGSAQAAAALTAEVASRRTTKLAEIINLSGVRSDARSRGQAVQALRIRPMLLEVPTATDVDLRTSAFSTQVPRQLAKLSLTIEGQEYLLWVVDSMRDSLGYRHVSATVLNVPGASASFTVAANGQVAGSLVTPHSSYRIVPSSGKEQLVYRLDPSAGSSADQLLTAVDLDRAARAVELRHVQAMKVAELQLEMAVLRDEGNVLATRGGNLGKLDPHAATEVDVRALLSRLGHLTNAVEYGEFHVVERRNHELRFQQLIGGIPVDAFSSIVTNREGEVSELHIKLADPRLAPSGEPISRVQAVTFAVSEYARQAGGGREVEVLEESGLIYQHKGGHELRPVYRFYVRSAGSAGLRAHVDALTGVVTLESTVMPAAREWGWEVYTTQPGTAPTRGSDPGATLTYRSDNSDEFAPGYCAPGVDCSWLNGDIGIPGVVMYELRMIFDDAVANTDPSLCCEMLGTGGSDHLQFIVGTPANTSISGQYNDTTEAITFPPSPNTPSTSQNADTVIHEITHHIQDKFGHGLDDWSRVMREGLADAMVGAVAEWRDPPFIDLLQQGEKWIVGDGHAGLPNGYRDIRVPRTLQFISDTLANVAFPDRIHWASQGVSNLMYRLYNKGVMTDTRFVEFNLKANYWMGGNWDGISGIQIEDLYHTLMLATRSNETALQNAIKQVWTEMGGVIPPPGGSGGGPGVPGGPGAPGAPGAPLAVDGYPLYCSDGVAWHSISWTGMPNTSFYRIHAGPYYDQHPASVTAIYAWANFSADVRVRSCNGAGCSGLSLDSYYMNYGAVCGF
jgi:hypothetical protein